LIDKLGLPGEDGEDTLDTGTIVVGDPESETEPYLEVDLDEGRFQFRDGEDVQSVDPGERAFDNDYYEESVGSLLELMGVDLRQTVSNAASTGAVSSGSSEAVVLRDAKVFVDRAVNGIPVGTDGLVFSYHADTGHLRKILGSWQAINYAESQFAISDSSIDELTERVGSVLTNRGIAPKELSDVSLSLGYRVNEDSRALDLVLEVQHRMSIIDVDI
jgi:hypothetical protein